MEDKVWSKAIALGKKWAKELENESNYEYVGAEQEGEFEVKGFKYKLSIQAWWEKSNHFNCSVSGIGNDYYKYKCCNRFSLT